MSVSVEAGLTKPQLFVERDLERPAQLPFLDGTAVVFTARSPEKATPNEDSAALIPFDGESGLVLVADGAGGTRSGGEASRLAVESLATALERAAKDGLTLRAATLNGIERANKVIGELGTGAATTIAIAQIKPGRVRPYHVGDSVVLVVGQRGKIKHQNVPHGPVGYAVEAGLLNESEAMVHEERHLVSNFVGTNDMRIEIGPKSRWSARDTLLVASDGLTDNLFLGEMIERVRKGPLIESANALLEAANGRMRSPRADQPSKPDDLTFILFRRHGVHQNADRTSSGS